MFIPKKQKLKIHTIATDLDGTLLNRNACLTSFSKTILQKAIDSNIQLIIATGRRFASALTYSQQLNRVVQIVCNNGQILRLSPDGARVKEHYLSEQLVREIIKEGKKFGLTPLLHVDEHEKGIDMILEKPLDHPSLMNYSNGKNRNSIQLENCLDYELNRVTVICWLNRDITKLHTLDKLLKRNIGLEDSQNVITTIPGVGPCMDVFQKGISKWTAIKEFLNINNKDESGTIAFGDEANDLEMIQNAGIGVAMKNAVEELKSVSNLVSQYSNTEDGVARTLVDLGIVDL